MFEVHRRQLVVEVKKNEMMVLARAMEEGTTSSHATRGWAAGELATSQQATRLVRHMKYWKLSRLDTETGTATKHRMKCSFGA